MTAVVLNGQTLFDLALQYCGDVSAAFDIAALNDIEVTSQPAVGTVLSMPQVVNRKVVDYYEKNNIKPATAFDIVMSGGGSGLGWSNNEIWYNNDIWRN